MPAVTIRTVPDGQLLQEASTLVSKVLGSSTRFSSRGQFHSWLIGGGMAALVKARAMKPLRYADPWSSLETVVGMLRLFGTRRPPESYERKISAKRNT